MRLRSGLLVLCRVPEPSCRSHLHSCDIGADGSTDGAAYSCTDGCAYSCTDGGADCCADCGAEWDANCCTDGRTY